MIRRFKFEGEIADKLDCVPMAVRRKLDRIGIKIGLEQWQALGWGERLAICHLPANLEEEREALVEFIDEAVARTGKGAPKTLNDIERRQAEPPTTPPPKLSERAAELGFELSAEAWHKLDSDERYALIKLAGGDAVSHNFATALKELLANSAKA